jgi:hypothetical protein
MMKIVDRARKAHVMTNNYEWTFSKNPEGQAFGAICDVRKRKKPWNTVVSETIPNFTINDPRSGGLFSFGYVVALPNVSDPPKDPENFWNWAWEITTKRRDLGFGILTKGFHIIHPKTIIASCTLGIFSHLIAGVKWYYKFHEDDRVELDMKITLYQYPGLFVKEPKIVCNGLMNFKDAICYDENGVTLEFFDFTKLPDPTKKTHQINNPRRYEVEFASEDGAILMITNDGGMQKWYDQANSAEAMHEDAGPLTVNKGRYCMPKDVLLSQWEIPYWPKEKISGLAMHIWEGGYGAPDCWNCFRPYPRQSIKYDVKLTAALH